jgi:hypothetical protein
MNNERTAKFTIFCVTLFFSATVLQITASAQKGAPVIVTNTDANPVPVTGGVAVTNSPTVKVDSSQPVSVAGVLGVENAVGASLLTRNQDAPTRQRVFQSFFGDTSNYKVPAGKGLVIDYISGIVANVPLIQPIPLLEVNSTGEPNRFYYLTPNGSFDVFGSRNWSWGAQTQMFFPAGSFVRVHQFIEVGNQALFSFHGYLVDVP